MPAQHDQAICIRHWDWSETSQTVGLFCRSVGCLRGLAKGARRERGRFSGGIDLLTRGEVGVILKRDSDLHTLTEWDAQEIFPRLREDLAANRAGWYVVDVLGRMLPLLDPHPDLFDRTMVLLRSLGSGEGVEASMLRFQWCLLEETGWQPDLTQPAGHSGDVAFDAIEGRLVKDVDREGPWRVRASTLAALRDAATGGATPPDTEAVVRANRLLAAHLRAVLGEEPATMSWLFGKLPVAAGKPSGRTGARVPRSDWAV
jgi:recombinational DNA repair protein (RecF pathway)